MADTSSYDITEDCGLARSRLPVSAAADEHDGLCAVVSVAGRAGIDDCEWVQLLMGLRAAREAGRVVVDLSRLSSMDWWVALILQWVGRVISRRGGSLVLASPQPAVARVLSGVGAPGTGVRDRGQ